MSEVASVPILEKDVSSPSKLESGKVYAEPFLQEKREGKRTGLLVLFDQSNENLFQPSAAAAFNAS